MKSCPSPLRLRRATPQLTLVLAAVIFSAALTSGRAALLWYADFETYADNAPVSIGTAFDGANDTFTSRTGNATVTAQAAAGPFATGMYAEMSVTGSGTSAAVRQIELAPFGANDVRVLSFDLAQAVGSDMAFTAAFINNANGNLAPSGWSSLGGTSIPSGDLIRLTAVYNQSGSAIALPGGLGTVDSGFGALYFKTSGGTYSLAGTPVAVNTGGAGFSLSWSAASLGEAGLFDNVGMWSSATDTVGGTSVLELNPGSIVVPEPSAAAFLVGSMVMGVAWRRSRRRV